MASGSNTKVGSSQGPKLTQTRYAGRKADPKTEPEVKGPQPGQDLIDGLQSGQDYLSLFRNSVKQHNFNLDEVSAILKILLERTWRHRTMLPRVLELCYDCGSTGHRAFNEFLTVQDEKRTIGFGHLRVILNSELKLDQELIELFQLRLENRVMEILELQSLLTTGRQ